jgi:hypothetical protein
VCYVRIISSIKLIVAYESNVLVGSGLVAMYVKCGGLEEALQVFSKILLHNVGS